MPDKPPVPKPSSSKSRSAVKVPWYHSTRIHLEMYSALLIATPFIMLQSYLQQAISRFSRLDFTIFDAKIPVVLVIAAVLISALVIIFRKKITRRGIIAGMVVVVMITVAQQITDIYANHRFYDLQQNWHYIAYGIFAFMMYRDLEPRGMPLHRIMLWTYVIAILYSAFDEAFQRHMTNRVFDISDIAKDSWGSVMGMVLLLVGGRHSDALLKDWRKLRHARIADYFRHPMTLLLLMTALTLILVFVGSLLTEYEYLGTVILITLGIFLVLFAIWHLSQYRIAAYVMLSLFTLGLAAQTYSFVRHRDEYITHNRYGLTVYKGIPLPFFDIIFYRNGTFRMVDKKHSFNQLDRSYFLQQYPDIIVIGSGAHGKGGQGFPRPIPSQFILSPFTKRGVQVIILETPKACEVFNRLKKERKNVVFVLHNTC